jgi:cell division protein ZapA (FtsZ GTPase activity inhibitor)
MSDSKVHNQVVVNIFGDEYPITAASDPEYISRVADLVDSRMKEIARGSRSQARDKLAILTAMSFASELSEKNDSLSAVQHGNEGRLEKLIQDLDNLLSHTQ